MAKKDWPRWIHSSIAQYFSGTITVPFIVEGVDERDPTYMARADRAEVRVNGPFTQELSKNYFRLYVDVNVIVFSQMGGSANTFALDDNLGSFFDAMDSVIPIYRYGTGPDDDSSLLGCLSPRPGVKDAVRVLHFGQIDKDTRLKEGMVDARYQMFLEL